MPGEVFSCVNQYGRAKTWKRERADVTLHSAQITHTCTAVVVVVVVVVAVAGAGVGVVEHIS